MHTDHSKPIDEPRLVALLKQKDRAALTYLYDHYSAALYGIIYRIVREDTVSEEVLQDAFIKIWDKIDAYDAQRGRLFTWMMNITRNLAIDKLRSKEFSRAGKTDRLDNVVSSISPTLYVEQTITDPGLRNLLHNLSPEQQMIIDLVYFKGYTHSEVADEFDMPLGTVKTRLRAALIKLRKLMNVA